MVFMRRHVTKQSSNTKSRRCIPNSLTSEQLALLARALDEHSVASLEAAYERWGIPWTGVVTEWELLTVIRNLLALSQDAFDDDAVHTLWNSLDQASSGKIEAALLVSLGKDLLEGLCM